MSLTILHGTPWFWLALAVVFIIVESLSLSLTTIWFACSAILMVFLSLTPLPFQWQLLLFAVVAAVLLIFTRPIAMKKLNIKRTATNSDSLIGKKTLVIQGIGELEKGTVKVNGIVWTARSADGTAIASGTECTIESIEGNTVVVKAIGVPT